MKPQRFYIITGEASGDLHGGNLCHELKKSATELEIRGWGGSQLESAGVQIDVRYERINFMGFTEVLKNLPTILKYSRQVKQTLLEYRPDAIILVDYPGFNLRLAQWCKQKNIPVYYFIAPQAWAWKENRVKILRKTIRKLFVILPFELEYFRKHGIATYYYGHPLLQTIKAFRFNPDFRKLHSLSNKAIIALLPGSRKQEIATMLPIYLEAIAGECRHQLVIAGLKQHQDLYEGIIRNANAAVKMIYDDTYNVLHQAKAAIVTSGTASLEAGLFGVPHLVCYKGNQVSYWIAKKLIKVKFISLVNLIATKPVVQEFIQSDCNPRLLRQALTQITSRDLRRQIKVSLKEIQSLLDGRQAYENVAREILLDWNSSQGQP